jgi:hypothetical protein
MTLSADESSAGLATELTFERVIVWPDGRREIEGFPLPQFSLKTHHWLAAEREILSALQCADVEKAPAKRTRGRATSKPSKARAY